jgi:ribonuclease HI
MQWRLEFDGSCWPNPNGKAGYGFILYQNGREVVKEHGLVGNGKGMSNNVAEHYALLQGLVSFQHKHPNLHELKYDSLEIFGDSKLVIEQISGRWRVHMTKAYSEVAYRVLAKLAELKGLGLKVKAYWVSRDKNQCCDDLSKMI